MVVLGGDNMYHINSYYLNLKLYFFKPKQGKYLTNGNNTF